MKRVFLFALVVAASGPGLSAAVAAAETPPAWLYAVDAGAAGNPAAAVGSADFAACAACHGANGMGRPGTAPIAGLPVKYFVAQMHAFREGTRKSADARKTDTAAMAAIAKQMSEPDLQKAADYFSRLKVSSIVQVVETKTVAMPGGKEEPIGGRIVEIPDRNSPLNYIAYVPAGMLNRGAVVVTTGRSKTQPCGVCHGKELRGQGDVPGIAGRSPTYLMRQLMDMKAHTRTGAGAETMKSFTEVFNHTDLLAVSAFIASRKP